MTLRLRVLTTCVLAGFLAGAQGQTHVVRPGDTLWDISKSRLASPTHWPEIGIRNRVQDPRLLRPGTVLRFGMTGARVIAVEGSAWYTRAGAAEEKLAAGQTVVAGDILATGAESFVTLGLPGGSRSVLPSLSEVEIMAADEDSVRLRLLQGRVESQVDKQRQRQRFEVETRSVGLGVRGTHFRVRDEDHRLIAEVLEGKVVLGNEGASDARRDSALAAGTGMVLAGVGASAGSRTLLPAPALFEPEQSAPSRAIRVIAVPGSTGYRIQLAEDESFLRPVYEQEFSSTQTSIPDRLPEGFYYLRTAAFDSDRIEGKNGTFLVYVPAAIAEPRLLPDGRVEIHWRKTAELPLLQISRRPDFTTMIVNERASSFSGAVLGPFVLAGRYYWRILSSQEGSGMQQGSFEIPPDITKR